MAKNNQPRSAGTNKAAAREAAKKEAARIKAEREAKERRNRLLIILAIIVGVVVAAVVITLVVVMGHRADSPTSAALTPPGATDNGGVVIGKDGVPGDEAPSGSDVITVEIYSDYMCPFCGKLETSIESTLDQLRQSGDIRLIMHPLALLDGYSEGSQYSTRTANDAAVVMKYQPDKFMAFHKILYANQPEENTTGLTDAKLADLAAQAGVSQSVINKFSKQPLKDWVTLATQNAESDGLNATPDVFMYKGNNQRVKWSQWNTMTLGEAIDNVKKGLPPDGTADTSDDSGDTTQQ
ncbi:MAG: DsbA family protein [Bifidobacteriaceae bacterium]|jgi:protein-disulfide isomerase|nr:DsbA family protein [Bifidobacteriaceae bacterium]